MVQVYFSLGSNLGDRHLNIWKAIELLDLKLQSPHADVSSLIETDPWGFDSENKFINCVVRYELSEQGKTPQCRGEEILDICKEIEEEMGREMTSEYDSEGNRIYHNRPIDIDILLYGDERIDTHRLKVPHPLMNERDFVLIPLNEILKTK